MAASDPLGELVAKLAEIAPLASQVADLKGQTIRQEAEALAAILERIKPLLPLVAHSILTGYHHSGQQGHEEQEDYHAVPGLELVNNFKRIPTDKDYRGEYGGSRLVLFQDGGLQWERRTGDWSQWQGEGSSWSLEEETEISAEQAVKKYGLKAIVAGLVDELKEASRLLEQKQADYQERLELVQKVREVLQ